MFLDRKGARQVVETAAPPRLQNSGDAALPRGDHSRPSKRRRAGGFPALPLFQPQSDQTSGYGVKSSSLTPSVALEVLVGVALGAANSSGQSRWEAIKSVPEAIT